MSAVRDWMHSKPVGVTASILVGLGLLTLGVAALMLLGLVLPAGTALADRNDDSWSERNRVQGEPFHWSGRLAPGKTLEIRGINGEIEAELASGNEVVVDARKSAHRSDPDEVEIEVVERPGGVLICARYPRPGGGLNDCDDHDGQHVRDNDVVVRYRVKVPAGVELVAKTVNGSIEIDGLKSDVDASTVNGSVEVSTTGTASAVTVNGSVLARIGSDLQDDLEFTTVNGRVVVEMPKSVNADVRGSTVHGSIRTEFPLAVRSRRWGNRRVEGQIGRGGHDLVVTTVNGSIELRTLDGKGSWKNRAQEDGEDEDDDDDGWN